MTFKQFKKLSHDQQEFAIRRKGQPVGKRVDCLHRYELIQLDGFYIEIVYSLRFNNIQYIASFEDIEFLDPYLQEMNIVSVTAI